VGRRGHGGAAQRAHRLAHPRRRPVAALGTECRLTNERWCSVRLPWRPALPSP
jgi:hypothetical protein